MERVAIFLVSVFMFSSGFSEVLVSDETYGLNFQGCAMIVENMSLLHSALEGWYKCMAVFVSNLIFS